MMILALIPALSGSKRVLNKNIRVLGGKPLIVWTIETALSIPGICDVLVSTDSVEIQAIGSAAGARVPWLRPSMLATDDASSVDVAIDALDRYENEFGQVDGLLLLQPTSPFRTKEYVELGIEKYLSGGGDSVIGVSRVRENPSWMATIENEKIKWPGKQNIVVAPFLDLNNLCIVNGALYLSSPKTLRALKSFYSTNSIPLRCDSMIESLDIDTEADFYFADMLMRCRSKERNAVI